MKKRILLIDESLTVQKVVALTLDKNRYIVQYAKSRSEALKVWSETPPDLALVGDQVSELTISSFPKEVEAWLGRGASVPPMILITSQDTKEQRHYAAVLKKPFAPSTLQALVVEFGSESTGGGGIERGGEESVNEGNADDFEDERLQKIFNDTFADESSLVRETFKNEMQSDPVSLVEMPQRTGRPNTVRWEESEHVAQLWDSPSARPNTKPKEEDLWGVGGSSKVATSPVPEKRELAAPAYSIAQETELALSLQEKKLDEIVDRVLSRIVPPIVERLVQERLDKLLKAHEEFVELKP